MGFLTVISETGMFHSACLLEIGSGGRKEWRGFHPKAHRTPVGRGALDHSDRTPYVNHYVRFAVSDQLLNSALTTIDGGWSGAMYGLGMQDCVSMSADLCRVCQLSVPAVNFTPYGLIQALRMWNDVVAYDVRPFPWSIGR